jgi:predicted RNA-binding Zn ribbon-like protein
VQSLDELPFIAGHVALDFVNTAEERGHPDAGDVLRAPADLVQWGRRHDLLSRSIRSRDDQAELRRALAARELLYALFSDRVHDRDASDADLRRLASLAAEAYRAASLEPASDGQLAWRWSPSELATIRHVAVTAALDLLSSQSLAALKQCPGDHCGWFFLDTTKRGNRRWCSMSECGQDAKNARRRAPHHHRSNNQQ